jgi:hypothetical protein
MDNSSFCYLLNVQAKYQTDLSFFLKVIPDDNYALEFLSILGF